jgi:hypothetical protein
MPLTEVYFYKDDDESVPVLDWLLELQKKNPRATRKCFSLIKLLRDLGNELRRPRADLLRDGVYELRTEVGKVNYRILYGFVGKNAAVLACGLTKKKTVPPAEIDMAVTRIGIYKKNPAQHRFVFEEESPDGQNH